MVEYGLILALVAVVAISGLVFMAPALASVFAPLLASRPFSV
jgi:Flp pilus assembly pilin Flp